MHINHRRKWYYKYPKHSSDSHSLKWSVCHERRRERRFYRIHLHCILDLEDVPPFRQSDVQFDFS